MRKNVLGLFIDKLLAFPLWVKQIIYLYLYKDLSLFLAEDFINVKEEDIFHTHVPILSFAGKSELMDRRGGFESNFYNFLEGASEGLSILELSMNNFWTMEEVAKYYILSLERDLIKIPESTYVHAMAGFMAGKFRTGEYFKRIGKINVDQLEETILKQKEYANKGTPRMMAEIMISLGFITEKDTSSILAIKEESKKRFILDTGVVPNMVAPSVAEPVDIKAYKDEIIALKKQNDLFKEKLAKLLAFLKQNQK